MTQSSDSAFSRQAPSFLPSTAVLEMTYRCNHRCLFCSCPWYAESNGFDIRPELTADEWISLIGQLCEMGVSRIAFTGGEPLIKEGVTDIISFAAECVTEHIDTEHGKLISQSGAPKLHLLTNGRSLNDDILALCRRHEVHLSLSLPGLTTFAYHTGGGDAANVLYWFKEAKNAGIGTTAGVTVTRKNLHELYNTISEAFIAGAGDLLMNRFLPGGRGLQFSDELSLRRDQIPVMLDTAEAVLTRANRRGHVGTELPKCVFDAARYTHLNVASRCSAGRDFFLVDPSGYVRVCNHSEVRLTHISQLNELKYHPYWKQFVQKDYLPSQCGHCEQILHCDGGCREAAHILTGSLKGADPALNPAADQ